MGSVCDLYQSLSYFDKFHSHMSSRIGGKRVSRLYSYDSTHTARSQVATILGDSKIESTSAFLIRNVRNFDRPVSGILILFGLAQIPASYSTVPGSGYRI